MSDLDKTRAEIGRIDEEMAKLFEQRMACSKEVAAYKKERGLPILDAAREKSLIERDMEYITNPDIKGYYRDFLESVLDVSKRYQHKLMTGVRVAYSGIEGSFAAISCARILPDAERVSYKNFAEAYNAVVEGECDLAVLPIENSYAGEVGQVTDLMFQGDLYVNGIYELAVSQCLLGVPGSTVESLRTVVSHPQALEQCAEFTYEHQYKTVSAENTARAAKDVADKGDITVGAIASAETAELYGLTILQHSINKSANNTTRFAVFSRAKDDKKKDDLSSFILMFTVKNEAGTLARAISIIGAYGYSMRVIRSRPMKDMNWQYYFYTEIEGKITTEKGQQMLKELGSECEMLKVIGSYKPNCKI